MKPDVLFPPCTSCAHSRYAGEGNPLYCERLQRTPKQVPQLANCVEFEYEPGTDAVERLEG